jgi:hypothetical protein
LTANEANSPTRLVLLHVHLEVTQQPAAALGDAEEMDQTWPAPAMPAHAAVVML